MSLDDDKKKSALDRWTQEKRYRDFLRAKNPGAAKYGVRAMRFMRHGGFKDNEFLTDIRQIGDTTVTMRRNDSTPPEVESYTPEPPIKPLPGCPKTDWGFADAASGDGAGTLKLLIDAVGQQKDAANIQNDMFTKQVLSVMNPALYTGAMRWVMQVAQGMKLQDMMEAGFLSASADYFGGPIPYVQPYWAMTCGIFIGTDQAGNPTRWLVEVGTSGAWRVPIHFCAELPLDWEAEMKTALATSGAEWAAVHEQLRKYWTVTHINWAGAVKIAQTTNFSMYKRRRVGFSTLHGWAFNRRGNTAATCYWYADPADPMGMWKRAGRDTLTITQNAAGEPASASSTQDEEDYLLNNWRDDYTAYVMGGGHNAILQVAGSPGYCQTFTCWPGFSGPGVKSTRTPVFAYYDESDALQVVYSRYRADREFGSSGGPPTVTQEFKEGMREGDTENFMHGWIGVPPGGWDPPGTKVVKDLQRSSTAESWTTGESCYFESIALSAASNTKSGSTTQYTISEDGPVGYLSPVVFALRWKQHDPAGKNPPSDIDNSNYTFGSYGWGGRAAAIGFTETIKTTSNATFESRDVIVLHGCDRMSYVHARRETTVMSGISVVKVHLRMQRVIGPTEGYVGSFDAGGGWQEWMPISVGTYTTQIGQYFTEHVGTMYVQLEGEIVGNLDAYNQFYSSREEDWNTAAGQAKVVIGTTLHELDTTEDPGVDEFTRMYFDDYLVYRALASGFKPERQTWDTYPRGDNAYLAAAGFGYPRCVNNGAHAFIGVF
jgi:hypothetical protein